MRSTIKTLVFLTLISYAFGAEKNMVEQINIKEGETIVIHNIKITLDTLMPYFFDGKSNPKKWNAFLEFEKNEQNIPFELGGYYEKAQYAFGYHFSLVSAFKKTAVISIEQFPIFLDASKFESELKNMELHILNPFQIHDVTFNIKSLYRNNVALTEELILHVDILHNKTKFEIWNSGANNYLNYIITPELKKENILITIKPVCLGDEFKLVKGDSFNIVIKDEILSLNLTNRIDDGKKITMSFAWKTKMNQGSGDIILKYNQKPIDFKNVPKGKKPYPNDKIYNPKESQLELNMGKFKLINLRKSTILNFNTTSYFKIVEQK